MRKKIFFGLLVISIILHGCSSSSKVDKIVIVDVANLGREMIANEIAVINSLKPNVIAIDLQFSYKGDHYADSLLAAVLAECNNLVMISVIEDDYTGDSVEYDRLTGSLPEFLKNAKTGFANILLEDDERQTVKRFSTFERVGGRIEYHFAVRTAIEFDSLTAMSFVNRNRRIVI